jgi:hypothetical protein
MFRSLLGKWIVSVGVDKTGLKKGRDGVPGCDDHPPPTSTEIKEGVDLYLFSPLGLHGLF